MGRTIDSRSGLIAVLFVSSNAFAVEVRSDHDGLSMEWQPRTGRLCVISNRFQPDRVECSEEDRHYLQTSLPQWRKTPFSAMVSGDGFRYFLTYDITDRGKRHLDINDAQRLAREALDVYRRIGAGGPTAVDLEEPESPARLMNFAGATTVRFKLHMRNSSANSDTTIIHYAVLGSSSRHDFEAIAPRGLETAIEEEVEVALSKMKLDVVPSPNNTGNLVGRIFGGLMIASVIFLYAKSRKALKKRRRNIE